MNDMLVKKRLILNFNHFFTTCKGGRDKAENLFNLLIMITLKRMKRDKNTNKSIFFLFLSCFIPCYFNHISIIQLLIENKMKT